jgi:hypothetical protein
MLKKVTVMLLITMAASVSAANSSADLQQQLLERVEFLTSEIDQLRGELNQLKQERQQQKATLQEFVVSRQNHTDTDQTLVDLSHKRQQTVHAQTDSHVLSNPWWQNIEIWGFGAAGYYDTGSGGTRDHGSFEVKEATLFFEADVWQDISFFLELQTNRLDKDDEKYTRTGEVYIHWRDLQLTADMSIGVKVGRFDIPFGEEYLWQDAVDNPLITFSAIYPYGWDEGVLVYSQWGGVSWIAAVTDGTDARSREDNSQKAFNLKAYGNVTESLYLSASYMNNGDNVKSAVEFGGSHFEPVAGSSAGSSSSDQVDSDMFQVDAKYQFMVSDMSAYIALAAGYADQQDDDSDFDRDFRWFMVEPYLQLSKEWYAVLRYSEIGTYDSDEGYHFDGKPYAGGNSAFGFDTERLRRLGVGLGWQPNPRLTAKLELGKDWFDLIDASPLEDEDRNFIGLEMTVGF